MNLKKNSQKWATWGFYALLPIAAISLSERASANAYPIKVGADGLAQSIADGHGGGHADRADQKAHGVNSRFENAEFGLNNAKVAGVRAEEQVNPLNALLVAEKILTDFKSKGFYSEDNAKIADLEKKVAAAKAQLDALSPSDEGTKYEENALDQVDLVKESLADLGVNMEDFLDEDAKLKGLEETVADLEDVQLKAAQAEVELAKAEVAGDQKAILKANTKLTSMYKEMSSLNAKIVAQEAVVKQGIDKRNSALLRADEGIAALKQKVKVARADLKSAEGEKARSKAQISERVETMVAGYNSEDQKARMREKLTAQFTADAQSAAIIADEEIVASQSALDSAKADLQAGKDAKNQLHSDMSQMDKVKEVKHRSGRKDYFTQKGALSELNRMKVRQRELFVATATAEQMTPEARINRLVAKKKAEGKPMSASQIARTRAIFESQAKAQNSKAQRSAASAQSQVEQSQQKLADAEARLARVEKALGKESAAAEKSKSRWTSLAEKLGLKKK